jgi:hypothetical protein
VPVRTGERMNSAGPLPRPSVVRSQLRWRKSEIEAWITAGMPNREEGERPNRGNLLPSDMRPKW